MKNLFDYHKILTEIRIVAKELIHFIIFSDNFFLAVLKIICNVFLISKTHS